MGGVAVTVEHAARGVRPDHVARVLADSPYAGAKNTCPPSSPSSSSSSGVPRGPAHALAVRGSRAALAPLPRPRRPTSRSPPPGRLSQVRFRQLDPDWRAFGARLAAIGVAVYLLDVAAKLEGGTDIPQLCVNMLFLCLVHCVVLALLTVRVVRTDHSDTPTEPLVVAIDRADPCAASDPLDDAPPECAPSDAEPSDGSDAVVAPAPDVGDGAAEADGTVTDMPVHVQQSQG
jgi:hypothetical protein